MCDEDTSTLLMYVSMVEATRHVTGQIDVLAKRKHPWISFHWPSLR